MGHLIGTTVEIDIAQALNALAIVLAAWLAYMLGRRAGKQDRLRQHELASIRDTRDRLLDMARYADALVHLQSANVVEFQKALSSLRYGRARTTLIADDGLIDLLTTTLPKVAETFPDTSDQVRSDVSRLGNAVREVMFEQEATVHRTGKPKLQTKEQQERLDRMIEALYAQLPRYRGWKRVVMFWRTWRRMTFG